MVDTSAGKPAQAHKGETPKGKEPAITDKKSGFQKMFEKWGALLSGFFSKVASALPKPKPKMEAQYVPETPKQLAEKKGEEKGEEFETEVDRFLALVRERKRIGLKEAAAILKENEAIVEEWATILDRSGIVKLVYPSNPMESPYVVLTRETESNNKTR